MQESSAAGDIFAILFLLALLLVLFGVPTWLMIRHYRKSKPKLAAEKEAYNRLSPAEKSRNRKVGYANLAGVIGMVFGIFIGSRLQMIVVGIIMGTLLGAGLRFTTEKMLRI